jgi:hypothetical protein
MIHLLCHTLHPYWQLPIELIILHLLKLLHDWQEQISVDAANAEEPDAMEPDTGEPDAGLEV